MTTTADTTALTVMKLLARGRGPHFIAAAMDITAEQVRGIAVEHGLDVTDAAAAEDAVRRLERTADPGIPARETPAPRPHPPVGLAPATGDVLSEVALARLRPDPDNPRSDVGDITDLTASLKAVGLLQPIVARRTAGGQLVVVAGHRRLAAARLAGWTSVQVIVRRDMRPDDVLAAMLVENSHRKDLDPIEEARGLARLKGQLRCTDAEIGRRIGRHQTHVSSRIALLALSAEDQAAVRSGDMKLVEATAKARLNAGRVRPARPDTAYFSAAHELAPLARARCRRLHTRVVTMPGGIACGDCWSSVIRASERQDIHRRSAERGQCAICDEPYGQRDAVAL